MNVPDETHEFYEADPYLCRDPLPPTMAPSSVPNGPAALQAFVLALFLLLAGCAGASSPKTVARTVHITHVAPPDLAKPPPGCCPDLAAPGSVSVSASASASVSVVSTSASASSSASTSSTTPTTSQAPTPVAATLQSTYDPVNNFRWKGIGGSIDGQANPSFQLSVNQKLSFTIKHGSDVGDDASHTVDIKRGTTKLAESGVVSKAGDTVTLDWTPTAAGSYTYECKFHGSAQGGSITVS